MDDVTGLGTPHKLVPRFGQPVAEPMVPGGPSWHGWASGLPGGRDRNLAHIRNEVHRRHLYATMCTAGTRRGPTCALRATPRCGRLRSALHMALPWGLYGAPLGVIWRSLRGYMGLPWKFRRARTREVATGRSVPVAAARSQRRCAFLAEGFLPAATLRLEAVECDERL